MTCASFATLEDKRAKVLGSFILACLCFALLQSTVSKEPQWSFSKAVYKLEKRVSESNLKKVLQDVEAILQDFQAIIQDFQAILQDFQAILQDFETIQLDFEAIQVRSKYL